MDNRFATTSTPGIADVQSVATHEVGHLIGLDHSMVPTASMAPSLDVSAGELRPNIDRQPSSDGGALTSMFCRQLIRS